MKVNNEFYLQNDVLEISRSLLGKFLYTNINGCLTGGMIVETEAYKAPEDKASHAYGNRRTARTETFFKEGGISYVYMCYGIHNLFNIITNFENIPHAVLIRGIEPKEGIEVMLKRRNKNSINPELTAGPGALSQALGITREHNGISLLGNLIWIEDESIQIDQKQIIARPRVGISYAEEFALMPWRFSIKDNKFVSKAK